MEVRCRAGPDMRFLDCRASVPPRSLPRSISHAMFFRCSVRTASVAMVPRQQTNGLRLDRRSSVLRSGLSRRVVPGNSQNSFLYHRVASSEYGMQMPPTGALRPEQIELIKRWIDEGADWPDSLANEVEMPPLDPKAVAMVSTLRTGDVRSFLKAVTADPKLLNTRGPGGATPFMYAVLYTDTATVEKLLEVGCGSEQAQ